MPTLSTDSPETKELIALCALLNYAKHCAEDIGASALVNVLSEAHETAQLHVEGYFETTGAHEVPAARSR